MPRLEPDVVHNDSKNKQGPHEFAMIPSLQGFESCRVRCDGVDNCRTSLQLLHPRTFCTAPTVANIRSACQGFNKRLS